MEAALVNARIRKAWLHYGLKVASVGPATNLTYPKKELGNDLKALEEIASGSHKTSKQLQSAKNPAIVVGMGALSSKTNASVRAAVAKIAALNPKTKINILHTDASRVAAQDLGLVPGPGPHPTPKVVFLLGADSPDIKEKIPPGAFVIYQGSHGDEGASMADVVLPGSTYFEKAGTYVNLEGRPQRTNPVVTVPADLCREDFKILIGVMDTLGMQLPYTNLDGVRQRLSQVSPTFGNVGELESTTFHDVSPSKAAPCSGSLAPYLTNHWMTNPILRSSVVMGKCTAQLPEATSSYI
jgi:NADH dehydrogenase/NADH:ubiquinone oxidoreductase subunit G